jgi:general secretion pathway protein G
MQAKRGFTLVEILIVVVILGILAAIVIPQFTEASTEAKLSSLCSDLQTIRSQIELYKVQHNDAMPGTAAGVSFTKAMTGGTTLAGAVDAAAPLTTVRICSAFRRTRSPIPTRWRLAPAPRVPATTLGTSTPPQVRSTQMMTRTRHTKR